MAKKDSCRHSLIASEFSVATQQKAKRIPRNTSHNMCNILLLIYLCRDLSGSYKVVLLKLKN